MITGDLRSKIDRIWDDFWSGGISNPLTVIEQITYLLFIKRLDEIHTNRELTANINKTSIENPVFPQDRPFLRWSRFKDMEARDMYENIVTHVFPFIKNLHTDADSAYSIFMKDAVFIIPTPQLLERVVTKLDALPMDRRDIKGDLYEYLLAKIATAGQNGQFRTPRHIIRMMVEMVKPQPDDVICDPASGTSGFLVEASEYLREHHKEIFLDDGLKEHFNNRMFYGNDFDVTMLRIGAINLREILSIGVNEKNIFLSALC
ncbi:MAG: hypothetical protein QG657_1399 [Acidobacteriota bacterium]|nr:hypothetical protein [Acidobacteriota bacterium]